MSWKEDIRKAIKMGSETDDTISVLCQVTEVDEVNRTCYCVPVDGTADIPDVNLMPVGNTKGFLIIPKIAIATGDTFTGGYVMVTMTGHDDGFISMFGEVDKIYLNSDNFGGLIIASDLVEKINNLEKLVNDLVSKYNSHVHIFNGVATVAGVPGTCSGTTNTTTSLETTILVLTQVAEIVSKVTFHGSGL